MLKGLLILGMFVGTAVAADEVQEPIDHSVVQLRILREDPPTATPTRYKKQVLPMGRGICSGAFIDDMGDIITAGHCAQDAVQIDVITYDNRMYQAVVVATSAVHDLALLHIDRLNTPHFSPAKEVIQGEKIFVLGSPLAITGALTTGIVSKVNGDIIFLDCGVLPGNSGSAVFDENGNLVGVVNAGLIVGMGTTHLNIAQSIDAVIFFVMRAFRGVSQ